MEQGLLDWLIEHHGDKLMLLLTSAVVLVATMFVIEYGDGPISAASIGLSYGVLLLYFCYRGMDAAAKRHHNRHRQGD